MPNFDSSHSDRCLDQLMRWIDSGRIEVLTQVPKLIEKALAYVRFATREKACGLRAWDAAHLIQACHWALSIGATVHIITSDTAFRDFLKAYPEFMNLIRVYDPHTKRVFP